jgi:glycerophosphoryl diester phosphodiesterase
MAHRGASKRERENTTVAFRVAGALGADGVELDVRRCATGELVVHHNPTLADGTPLMQVARADLPDDVPTLDAALDACAGMWVNVEIKNDPAEPDFDPQDSIARDVVSCLLRRGEDARWLISSFRRETVDACRQLAPTIATAWLTVVIDDPDAIAQSLVASGHAAIHPYVELLTRDALAVMHDHGLAVNVWTCDDPMRMTELVEWGIDGICTNVPDVALARRTRTITPA